MSIKTTILLSQSDLKPPFIGIELNAVKKVIMSKMKRICKTEYKYVSVVTYDNVLTYRAAIPKYKWMKCFAKAKDAALAVDLKLIEKGKSPVNVLKKK